MFGFLGNKSGSLVGVDVGSSSVKLVALSKSGNGFSLEAYAVVSLPPTAVIDGNIQDVIEVTTTIEKAVKVAGGKMSSAVAAVPASAVITKKIEMSNAFTEFELEDQIKVEADQFIPYPLDEVALDFEVQGKVPNNDSLNKILLVACRKSDVEQREDAIGGAGLKCLVVDVDTYAVERAFPLLINEEVGSENLVGVVDIGAATLTLNVFKSGEIVYSREQAFGGNDLTNSIHQQYGMSIEEVEQSLRLGDISSEINEMIVMPFRGTVAQQVSRSLQFFYSSGAHSELSVLYLSGGTSTIDGLVDQLTEELGIPTKMANPFSSLAINSRVNRSRLDRDAPSLIKACGLAMRGFEG
ncbi:type IV pilus assembly protein PilM [Neptuniibacter caesariensis]|uniref:Type IV pilus assembly protein PilM n=1 Tax=Neptuniibacter caesariensis TaxID=207954 RepID=A0A7U8GST6_NEPCE|nr:type IV pilus assembly protein PilM [Neptuniibacter caesariensis]EAR61420.1 Type IV pilus assembly protein PilM [Oceanospirillum sp. MED92] [Neptuniibacter caesariensis]